MSGFAAGGEPGTDMLAGISKIVFSRTLKEPLEWANTKLIDRDAAEAVRELKDRDDGRSMRTLGSISLCRSAAIGFGVLAGPPGADGA